MTTPTDIAARLRNELWHHDEVTSDNPRRDGWTEHAVLARGNAIALFPVLPRSVAAASLMRWTDAETTRGAAVRLAGWTGLRTGLAMPLLRTRVWVAADRPDSLHAFLAQCTGSSRVHIAGTFGPPRPNQKPVLRIFDPAGQTSAFAKVGWNDLTSGLVTHEASFLAQVERPAGARLALPRLIDQGAWAERTIAVMSPLLGKYNIGRPATPSTDVLREVAALADTYTSRLADSPFRRRLATVASHLREPRVDAALARIDQRWSGLELPFGRWHGDWTPWNLSSSGRMVVAWDWERTAPHTPVGFDSLHFEFQRRLTTSKAAPVTALVGAVAAATATMMDLGVPALGIPAIASLYAAEMTLRFADSANQPASGVPWVEGLLDAALGHFASG